MAEDAPIRLAAFEIMEKLVRAGGFPRFIVNTKQSRKPFTVDARAGNKKIDGLKLPDEIDNIREAKGIACELILNSVYDEWEFTEKCAPFAETTVIDLGTLDLATHIEEAVATMEKNLVERVAKIKAGTAKTLTEDQVQKLQKTRAIHQERVEKFYEAAWPSLDSISLFEDPNLRWSRRLQAAIEEFALKVDWEFEHTAEYTVSASVTLHRKSAEKDADPEFLFKVEHEQEFDADQVNGRRKFGPEKTKEQLIKRVMAESIVSELIEGGVIEHADAGVDKQKERQSDPNKSPRKKATRTRKSRGGGDKQDDADKKPEVKKETSTKKKDTPKTQRQQDNNNKRGSAQRTNTVGQRKRPQNGTDIYRGQNRPTYLNGQPPAQNVVYVQGPPPPQQGSYYRAGPPNSAPQNPNTAQPALQQFQASQQQQLQAFMAQQQAQYQQAAGSMGYSQNQPPPNTYRNGPTGQNW